SAWEREPGSSASRPAARPAPARYGKRSFPVCVPKQSLGTRGKQGTQRSHATLSSLMRLIKKRSLTRIAPPATGDEPLSAVVGRRRQWHGGQSAGVESRGASRWQRWWEAWA